MKPSTLNPQPSTRRPVPAWHAEASATIKAHFTKIHDDFVNAAHRAVWLGLFFQHIKAKGKADDSIPHGRFMAWMASNHPDIKRTQWGIYMTIGRGIVEKCKLQITASGNLPAVGELPPAVLKEIAGKSQNQLFLECKQAKMDDEGCFNPARGRQPGEGGKDAIPTDPLEAAEYWKGYAMRRMGKAAAELEKLSLHWLDGRVPDDILTGFVSILDRTTKCLNAHINTAPASRDHKVIAKLWKTL